MFEKSTKYDFGPLPRPPASASIEIHKSWSLQSRNLRTRGPSCPPSPPATPCASSGSALYRFAKVVTMSPSSFTFWASSLGPPLMEWSPERRGYIAQVFRTCGVPPRHPPTRGKSRTAQTTSPELIPTCRKKKKKAKKKKTKKKWQCDVSGFATDFPDRASCCALSVACAHGPRADHRRRDKRQALRTPAKCSWAESGPPTPR